MNSSNPAASQVDSYVQQMRSVNPGFLPIWNPSPFRGQEVQIGDVGYIYKGSFRRLFNVNYGASHVYNQGTVPDKFQPFEPKDSEYAFPKLRSTCATDVLPLVRHPPPTCPNRLPRVMEFILERGKCVARRAILK